MAEPPTLSGIILAAGGAARMGRPKQIIRIGGRPMLQHVIDAARKSCLHEVLVVLGARAEEIRAAITLGERVRAVVNECWAEGQSTSLGAGLRAVDRRADAAAILLGDQPSMTAALIDRVARAFACGERPIARPIFTASESGERTPGHPVILARSVWPVVEQLRGDTGMRAVLARHPEWILEVPIESEPPADIDTEQDLAATAPAASASPAHHDGQEHPGEESG